MTEQNINNGSINNKRCFAAIIPVSKQEFKCLGFNKLCLNETDI